jgi:uncharacterized protein (TIGR03435 family)
MKTGPKLHKAMSGNNKAIRSDNGSFLCRHIGMLELTKHFSIGRRGRHRAVQVSPLSERMRASQKNTILRNEAISPAADGGAESPAGWHFFGHARLTNGVSRRRNVMRSRHAALIALVIASNVVSAQTQFEVASIRPNLSPDRSGTWRFTEGGRFTGENIPLVFLLMTAYRLRDSQISGAPGWAETEKYDIVAKGEGNPSEDQVMTMLQGLLADRFKFKYHMAVKKDPVYAMVPAKTGIKVKPSKEPAGKWFTHRNQVDATGVTMKQFAVAIASALDRPVLDKTGFLQTFDAHLEWDPEGTEGPSIFTAIQEQLGVKLEAQKGPVQMLVIDHIEKPGEN